MGGEGGEGGGGSKVQSNAPECASKFSSAQQNIRDQRKTANRKIDVAVIIIFLSRSRRRKQLRCPGPSLL